MQIDEYQSLAARTINQSLTDEDVERHALHEISSECGEIHSVYQKTYQGHELDENELVLEIGDLLWGIAELCTARGWSMDVVAERNINKLKQRYPDGFDPERSIHRPEYEQKGDSK